ncbi:MAG: hypothetical protein HN348_03225 [Proteobacteria bacterium]|jgi:hypothetical protein|nr:hypothetical protein [Pseudomonadota bacterium]
MKTCKPIALTALAIIFAIEAHAVSPEDSMDASQLATGWTAAADARNNGAITVNPGLLALEERYGFLAHLKYGPHPNFGWAASLMDSETSKHVALGLAYNRDVDEPGLATSELPGWVPEDYEISNRRTFHDVTVAVGIPLFKRRFSIGINGTLSIFEHDRLGKGTTGNMDIGLGLRPIPALTMGIIARNFLPIEPQSDRPASLLYGIRLEEPKIGGVAIELDQMLESTGGVPFEVAAGLTKAIQVARLRLGYRWDGPHEAHWVTTGVSAENEFGGIGYGVAFPVHDFAAGQMIHQLSLNIRINTALEPPEDY